MKARIKETGGIVEVEDLYDDGTALVNGRYFKVSELDFFDNFETIDWEQRRYEIAKSMMAAFLSNSCSNVYMNTYENQAQEAVKYADVLIEELKKGK
jgi:hypothetical protein